MFCHCICTYYIAISGSTELTRAKCILICYHRLLSHPLRKYPGPLSAKLTDIYGALYAFKTNLHVSTWQDHVKYGNGVTSRSGGSLTLTSCAGPQAQLFGTARTNWCSARLIVT